MPAAMLWHGTAVLPALAGQRAGWRGATDATHAAQGKANQSEAKQIKDGWGQGLANSAHAFFPLFSTGGFHFTLTTRRPAP